MILIKDENNLEESLIIEENETKLNLKHFIYLDKNKLHSYSSQILGGIVQIKRLTENTGNKISQNSDELSTEKIQEDGKEGEVTMGPKNTLGGMSGKTINKTTDKSNYKKGVNTEINEWVHSSTEDMIEHDYGYLKFEENLIERNILKEISNIKELEKYSSLIKIKGICKFTDWDSIMEAFNNREMLELLIKGNLEKENITEKSTGYKARKQQEEKNIKIGITIIKAFSFGPITVNIKTGNFDLVGSLNPEYLRATKEQFRTAYIMPGDVEMTIVGFMTKRVIEKTSFPGIGATIDMRGIWKEWMGNIDAVIEPIAIYTEIN